MAHIPNYFVTVILKLLIMWGLLEYTEFLIAPQKKKSGGDTQRSWRPNGFRNDSVPKHVFQECHRHMRCMSRNTILLKVGLVNFVFFQLRKEGIHTIVTVPLGVESPRKKWVRLYATFQHKHQSSHHAAATRGTHACFFVL
jgi:hypothetical protein